MNRRPLMAIILSVGSCALGYLLPRPTEGSADCVLRRVKPGLGNEAASIIRQACYEREREREAREARRVPCDPAQMFAAIDSIRLPDAFDIAAMSATPHADNPYAAYLRRYGVPGQTKARQRAAEFASCVAQAR